MVWIRTTACGIFLILTIMTIALVFNDLNLYEYVERFDGTHKTVSTSRRLPPPNVNVTFMALGQVEFEDFYAGAWMQNTSRFLQNRPEVIGNLEGGSFMAVADGNDPHVRMTTDWLDFSVEHLSKWWKLMDIFSDDLEPYKFLVARLRDYAENNAVPYFPGESPLNKTIALVVFHSWRDNGQPDRARMVSVLNLAATLSSLLRVGFGRALVVGSDTLDMELAGEARQYLTGVIKNSTSQEPLMEIVALQVNVTKKKLHLLPKVGLKSLQKALRGYNITKEDRTKWIGEGSTWDYVYFTEADTILNTRPWALSALMEELTSGHVLTPHRLQPMPHASDLPNTTRGTPVRVEGNLSFVTELDSVFDSCCDGGNSRPGAEPSCGNFWYMCGFGQNEHEDRLGSYGLMRLRQGTMVTLIAGSEHARRCYPRKGSLGCNDNEANTSPTF